MMYFKLFVLFFLSFFIIGCGSFSSTNNSSPEIIYKDYQNETLIFERHKISVDIHLENIVNPDTINETIRSLIYDNKNFDEYAEYRENRFIEDRDGYDEYMDHDEYPEYIYRYELHINYSIEHYCDLFVIIKHSEYTYTAGTAHGLYWDKYYIIDLAERKILNIDDVFYQVPDDILKQIIISQNSVPLFLADDIWPPDSIAFRDKYIGLLWNIYSIAPYSAGTISIFIHDIILQQYLTDRGKRLDDIIRKSAFNKDKR